MLEVKNLSVRYGHSTAIESVNLAVEPGEMVTVLGPNTAGKSSLGRAIAGLTPNSGDVTWEGDSLNGMSAAARVKRGVVYVPEGRRVFEQLTVRENLVAAGRVRRRNRPVGRRLEGIFDSVPRLAERSDVKAVLLSGGEQQLLAICRGIMTFPNLMILDEPSLGLAPSMIEHVAEFIRELHSDGDLTLLITEQNVAFASKLAQRGWIMHRGQLVCDIDQRTIIDPELVREAMREVIA